MRSDMDLEISDLRMMQRLFRLAEACDAEQRLDLSTVAQALRDAAELIDELSEWRR